MTLAYPLPCGSHPVAALPALDIHLRPTRPSVHLPLSPPSSCSPAERSTPPCDIPSPPTSPAPSSSGLARAAFARFLSFRASRARPFYFSFIFPTREPSRCNLHPSCCRCRCCCCRCRCCRERQPARGRAAWGKLSSQDGNFTNSMEIADRRCQPDACARYAARDRYARFKHTKLILSETKVINPDGALAPGDDDRMKKKLSSARQENSL